MKSVFLRSSSRLPILLRLGLCASCLGPSDKLRRFDDSASSPAIKSTPKVLIVLQPIKHSYYSYPAGRYIADLTDSEGTYYEAPQKVIQDSVMGGGTAVRTGGFYFPFNRPLHIHSYVMLGAPFKVGGEITDLSYRFEK